MTKHLDTTIKDRTIMKWCLTTPRVADPLDLNLKVPLPVPNPPVDFFSPFADMSAV